MSERMTISIIEEMGGLRTQAWLMSDYRGILVFSTDKASALVMDSKTAKKWIAKIFKEIPLSQICVREIRITLEAE